MDKKWTKRTVVDRKWTENLRKLGKRGQKYTEN